MANPIEPQLEQQIPLKHSAMGIASFIISLAAGVFLCCDFSGIVLTPGGTSEADNIYSGLNAFLGLGLFAILIFILVALGLGIVGLFQKNTKKTYAIFGTVISAGLFIGTLFVLILGLWTISNK